MMNVNQEGYFTHRKGGNRVLARGFCLAIGWRSALSSGYLTVALLGLLFGMGTWHLAAPVWGNAAPVLTGSVLDDDADGQLTVQCRTGGMQTGLLTPSQGHFRLDMGTATAPCLLEWHATDGLRLWGIATSFEANARGVEVSALSHAWVHFLQNVPLWLSNEAGSVPAWFAQAPVQALLQDPSTQQALAEAHFLPALRCLENARGGNATETSNGLALLKSLEAQGLLVPGRNLNPTTLAVLVLAGQGAGETSPPPCQRLLDAASPGHNSSPFERLSTTMYAL